MIIDIYTQQKIIIYYIPYAHIHIDISHIGCEKTRFG